MGLTEDEIVQILKLIEESHFDELHLQNGDLVLTISKHGRVSSWQNRFPAVASVGSAETRVPVATVVEHGSVSRGQVAEPEAAVVVEDGLVPIKAPMLGVFYRSPEPGAPPYVDVGTRVGPNDTVCLLEVMKVFNAVKAGVEGYVDRVCVENGQLVEYGQVLFLVKPADSSKDRKA